MKPPKILIVDDEEDIRDLYRSILEPVSDIRPDSEDNQMLRFLEAGVLPDSDEIENFFGDKHPEIDVEDELKTGYYSLSEASGGAEAVDMIQKALEDKNPYCLIFLDILMPPGIDGVQAAKQIRRLDKNVQIVIMTSYTGYTYEDILETIESEDRLLFFKKPFKKEQIIQLASSLTQRWYLDAENHESSA